MKSAFLVLLIILTACSKKHPKVTTVVPPPGGSSSQGDDNPSEDVDLSVSGGTDSPVVGGTASPVVAGDAFLRKLNSFFREASPMVAGGASGVATSDAHGMSVAAASDSDDVVGAGSKPDAAKAGGAEPAAKAAGRLGDAAPAATGGVVVADGGGASGVGKGDSAVPVTAPAADAASADPEGGAVAGKGTAFGKGQTAPVAAGSASSKDFAALKKYATTDMKEKFRITWAWDDLVNSPALKDRGGSDLFHFHLFGVIGSLDLFLRDNERTPEDKKQFAHLCRDPECSEGLDLDKITPSDLHVILDSAGWKPPSPLPIPDKDEGKPPEIVWFLQGFLSSPDVGPAYYRSLIENGGYETPSDSPHIKNIKETLAGIKNLSEVVVNLPQQFGWGEKRHQDVNLFMQLGRIIKQRNLTVRIMGRCGTVCANYLLPAARTVIMEPYGFIYTEGSIKGFYLGGEFVAPLQREYQLRKWRKEWLPQFQPAPESPKGSSYDLLVEFVEKGMLMGFDLQTGSGPFAASDAVTEQQRKKRVSGFMTHLQGWGRSQWGAEVWEEFAEVVLEEYRSGVGRSPRDWDSEDVKGFVRSLANEEQGHFLEKLALFLKFSGDEETHKWTSYLNNMKWLKRHTTSYHKEVTGTLPSQIPPYNYEGLLDLISHLTRDAGYESVFSVPKTYYATPESEKPHGVFLSADLLRKSGINIIGENNWHVLPDIVKDQDLYLDERTIKKCQFFRSLYLHVAAAQMGQLPSPVFTKDTFTVCTLKR